MSWFNRLTDFVASAVTMAKTVASRAINFMADKAENLVGDIKEVWRKVKPYVQKAPALLRTAARYAEGLHPLAGKALSAVALGLDALLSLENSPVLKKIEWAISSAAQRARVLQQQIRDGKISWLSPEEYEAALKTREALRAGEVDGEALSADDRRQIEIAEAITAFGIAKTDVVNAIELGPRNFEHYLRLRATQKLLAMSESKLLARGLDGLSENDWFMVRIAADLIKVDPELQSAAAVRLDGILKQSHGKTLQSFIYEELVAAWVNQSSELGVELTEMQTLLAKGKTDLRRLQIAKRVQNELDAQEDAELAALEKSVPELEREWEAANTRKRDVERYADAAEGFLQMLEKSPEQLEQEDRLYVVEDGEIVGRIIIDVAEKKTPFGSLSADDQAVITDFANIFHAQAKQRMKAVLEIEA